MSVLDYGRTRVRKSVFRICQNRTKFTNTLASCLLFENHALQFSYRHPTALFLTQFSRQRHNRRRQWESGQPFPRSVHFCPFAAPSLLLHTVVGTLSHSYVGRTTHKSLRFWCTSPHERVFHRTGNGQEGNFFHCCYFFFLPNRDSWPFFFDETDRSIKFLIFLRTKFEPL